MKTKHSARGRSTELAMFLNAILPPQNDDRPAVTTEVPEVKRVPTKWQVLNDYSVMLAWPQGTSLHHYSGKFATVIIKPQIWLKFRNAALSERKWNVSIVSANTLLECSEIPSDQIVCAEDPLDDYPMHIFEIEDFVFPSLIRCCVIE